MFARLSRLLIVVPAFAAGLAGAAPPDPTGAWIGDSTCVDRQRAPACNDERIRFVFLRRSGALHLDAQKWVGSAYDTMFEIDVVPDGAGREWIHDFETRRGEKARWTFHVADDGALEGRLLERPSGAPLRVVKAKRER